MTAQSTSPALKVPTAKAWPALLATAISANLAVAGLLAFQSASAAQLSSIRFANNINRTQVILDLSGGTEYQTFPLSNPDRLVIDLKQTQLNEAFVQQSLGSSSLVSAVRQSPRGGGGLRVVLDLTTSVSSRVLPLDPAGVYGHRLLIELVGQQALVNNERAVEQQSYSVAKGDTLFSVAQRHGVSLEELTAANAKQGNTLEIGDTLLIPPQSRPRQVASNLTGDLSTGTEAATAIQPVKLASGGWQHQVAQGESLFSISQRYGVDIESLQASNQMQDSNIRVGDILLVPSTPLSNPQNENLRRHKVNSGDTLYSLSKQYGVSIASIQSANSIRSSLLDLGRTLVIPSPSEQPTAPAQPTYAHGLAGRHTVAQGENLFQIARRHRISIVRLRRANGMAGDGINVGDELIIPSRVTATAQTDVYNR